MGHKKSHSRHKHKHKHKHKHRHHSNSKSRPHEIQVSAFEMEFYKHKIKYNKDDILKQLSDKLLYPKMMAKFDHTMTCLQPVMIAKTPSKWADFVLQSRMDQVILHITQQIDQLIKAVYGQAFSVKAVQNNNLQKSKIFGGKYQGYAFMVDYQRPTIPEPFS